MGGYDRDLDSFEWGRPRSSNGPRGRDALADAMQRQPQGLVDILDKILDKGLVVAGDIKVSLANVELLTIQLRLVICSVDKAEAIGINWWRSDRFYSSEARPQLAAPEDVDALRQRIDQLEKKLAEPGSRTPRHRTR
jgi:hypothetical protein